MKMLYIVIGISLCISLTSGLSCYDCTSDSYAGTIDEHQCFVLTENLKSFEHNCTNKEEYCRTEFLSLDGLIDYVNRSCEGPRFDQDDRTVSMPTYTECVTNVLSSQEHTTCYHSCNNKDNCNVIAIESLKPCNSNCSVIIGQGSCNYFTGECSCKDGWVGSNCEIEQPTADPTFLKCFQCSSETDSDCETLNTISKEFCPSAYQSYCTVTKTITYDEDDNIFRNATTRGCTTSVNLLNEEVCRFTKAKDEGLSNYNEYSCTFSCDSDGCNTRIPNGFADSSEGVALYCVQCSNSFGNCKLPIVRCPIGTTVCKSTVEYQFFNTTNKPQNPEKQNYKLTSVVRECAAEPVEKSCSSTKLESSNVQKVTCTETCESNNCNNGWPARPKCSQCPLTSCEDNPPSPSSCKYPHQKYCTLERINTDKLIGYPYSTLRRCSYYDETGCSSETYGDNTIRSCKKSCDTDGCNLGSESTILVPSKMLFLLPVLLLIRI